MALRQRVRIRGLSRQVAALEAMAKASGYAGVHGGRLAGELIMTDVKASRQGAGVPKKTGDLARSGKVTGPDSRGAVRLSFGGSAAPYALIQHERLDYHHDLGEPHYLVRGAQRFAQSGSVAQEKALAGMIATVVAAGKAVGGGRKKP